MKKIIIPIIGIIIVIISVAGWQFNANSKYTNPTTCLEATVNEIDIMRSDWNKNLKNIVEQEKPTSESTDEAFESMRTYRCWLDYLCETVLFSGNVGADAMAGKTLTSQYIDVVPGCVDPSKVVIPSTKLKVISQCQISKTSSTTPTLELAVANYKACKKMVALEFYADPAEKRSKIAESSTALEDFKDRSSAYVGLERQLKQNSAAQKSRILSDKLADIVTKMQYMEANMIDLNKYMNRFDSLMPCLAAKCD